MASLSLGPVETVGSFDWGGLASGGMNLASSIWGKSSAPTTTIINTGMPPWVLPVAVGGIGIMLLGGFAIFKKGRKR